MTKSVQFIFLLLTTITCAFAAKPITSPINKWLSSDNHIAVVESVAVTDSNKLEVVLKKSLWNNPPQKFSVKLNDASIHNVEMKKEYVIVFSSVMKHPIVRDEKINDPDGFRLLNYVYVDASIFEYSPAVLELFEARTSKKQSDVKSEVANLVELYASDYVFNQQLAVFELSQVKKTLSLLSEEQEDKVFSLMLAQHSDDELSTILLNSFSDIDKSSTKKHLLLYSRHVLNTNKEHVELSSYLPGLLQEAVIVVGKLGDESDQKNLSRMLLSNHPGIARNAVHSIMKLLSKESASNIFNEKLKSSTMLSDTRRAIQTQIKK